MANNSINSTDPSGESRRGIIGGIFGGLAAAVIVVALAPISVPGLIVGGLIIAGGAAAGGGTAHAVVDPNSPTADTDAASVGTITGGIFAHAAYTGGAAAILEDDTAHLLEEVFDVEHRGDEPG